jgi:NAD(P)-dependent dehydrogenase (short-subunit alcohol dehydrogenase family)
MVSATGRKSIFITGAASGIGRATARLFAAEGWFVGCFDRNAALLAALETEIGTENGLFRALDVTDQADYSAAIDAFASATGGYMDILHNNAGIVASGAFADMEWSTVMALVNINLIGVLFGIQKALPLLKATPGSMCFNTSSSSAIFGMGGLAVYSATKHAVRGLTEALAVELKPHGIRVADTLPGLVDTGMMPPDRRALAPTEGMWRLVQPEDVAHAVRAAYETDKIHWYVPEELAEMDRDATAAPEAERDKWIAMATFMKQEK